MVLLTSQRTVLDDELHRLHFLNVRQRLTVDVRGKKGMDIRHPRRIARHIPAKGGVKNPAYSY